MFGAQVIFFRGRQSLALIDGDEPWNGLLICTSREHHESLQKDFPCLAPHSILGKWLYVSQADADFEAVALRIRDLVRKGDPRVGIEPAPKRRSKKKKKKAKAKKKRSK